MYEQSYCYCEMVGVIAGVRVILTGCCAIAGNIMLSCIVDIDVECVLVGGVCVMSLCIMLIVFL